MTKAPCISIGLPVFNGAKYLAQAIDSFLGQSFGDFELILSDNASTDETSSMCSAYAQRDPRVRYSRNERNMGAAYNQNRTAYLATGRYFKWAGHDDWYGDRYLEVCVQILDSMPDVVLSYTGTAIIDDDGVVVNDHYKDNFHLMMDSPRERFSRVLRHSNAELLNPSLGLMHTDVLRKALPVGSYYASDRVLLSQVAMAGKFYEVPDVLLFRRVYSRKNNWTVGSDEQVAQWFDPAAKGKVTAPRMRKFYGYLNAIRRAPIPADERSQCYRELISFYGSGDRLAGASMEMRTLRQNVKTRLSKLK